MPTPLAPMLAADYHENLVTYPCFVQPKLDGIRAVWHDGRLWSRGLVGGVQKVFSRNVLPHIYEALQKYNSLDGELYVHGWSLQRINSAAGVNRKTPTADSALIQYHIYDVPDTTKSFEERFYYDFCVADSELKNLIRVDTRQCLCKEGATEYFKYWVTQCNYEGLIYRIGYNIYQSGARPASLLRLKLWKDCIANVTGYYEGERRLKGTMGGVDVFSPELNVSFKVGSGFTDKQRRLLWSSKPSLLSIKVRYERLTDGGVPYKPTLVEIL